MGLVAEKLLPENEAERLGAVRRYEILDTPADGAFDRITRLASLMLDMPIAIVSLVDHDRIWFKSAAGLEGVEQIDREPGLCASAILADEPWIIDDARADPRALANPLVAGEFGLRFYAGCALRTYDGFNLGTLCVIDQPRELTDEQVQRARRTLSAAIVVHEASSSDSRHVGSPDARPSSTTTSFRRSPSQRDASRSATASRRCSPSTRRSPRASASWASSSRTSRRSAAPPPLSSSYACGTEVFDLTDECRDVDALLDEEASTGIERAPAHAV